MRRLFVDTGPLLARYFERDQYHRLAGSPLFTIHSIDRSIEEEALARLESSSNPKVSFTDCTSFAFMEREEIREVLTFDDDFRREGFTLFGQ